MIRRVLKIIREDWRWCVLYYGIGILTAVIRHDRPWWENLAISCQAAWSIGMIRMEWPNIMYRYGVRKYGEDLFSDALHMSGGNYKEAFAMAKECHEAHLAGDCDLCGRE